MLVFLVLLGVRLWVTHLHIPWLSSPFTLVRGQLSNGTVNTQYVCVMSVIYSQCACHSNIDVRIQQAELEYQLGREELNLLTLMEESRNLQICLEDAEQNRTKNDASTIYRYVS